MEIKRPDEITKDEIPYVESPVFASGKISAIFPGYGCGINFYTINGLDRLVGNTIDLYYGRDPSQRDAYWQYYKFGRKERHWEYDFLKNDVIKKRVVKEFEEGNYLIVLAPTDREVAWLAPLFVQHTGRSGEVDQWQQYSFATTRTRHRKFEGILNRNHKGRLQPINDIYGGGTDISEPEEIVLTKEKWPERVIPPPERKQAVEKIVAPSEEEQSFMEAVKEYLGRVARGEILEENLAHYDDLLERAKAGDPKASRDMINEFSGFGGIAKVGKGITNGASRAAKFSKEWPAANLDDAVNKFAGSNPVITTTAKGKRIYTNPQTGIQVVEDTAGKYFRVFDPNITGKRAYLGIDGKIPSNKLLENGKQAGRSQAEYNQVTHFNISE